MTKLNEILNLIKTLSKEHLAFLKKTLLSETNTQNITEYVKARRFSQGRVCPICGCINIVRYDIQIISRDISVKTVEKHL